MIKYANIQNGRLIAADEKTGLLVVETPSPTPLEYGRKAVAHYEEQEGQIVKVWEVFPWTEEERQAIEAQEAQTADEEAIQ